MQRTNVYFANQNLKLNLKKYIAQQRGGFEGYVELSAVSQIIFCFLFFFNSID